MNTSKIHAINLRDFLKGAVVAVFAALAKYLYQAAINGSLLDFSHQDLIAIANLAAATLIGYLIKQFFTDEDNKFLGVF